MWKTMIAPLFNSILLLIEEETSITAINKILRAWTGSFKRFLMIPKSTNDELVHEMIGTNFEELVHMNTINALIKWDTRRKKIEVDEKIQKAHTVNLLKGISNEWCNILRLQCRICPKCIKTSQPAIMNSTHMQKHGIEYISYQEIWEDIKDYHSAQKERTQQKGNFTARLDRRKFLERWSEPLRRARELMEEKLDGFLTRRTRD